MGQRDADGRVEGDECRRRFESGRGPCFFGPLGPWVLGEVRLSQAGIVFGFLANVSDVGHFFRSFFLLLLLFCRLVPQYG